jgi:aminopeptidase N
MRPMSRRAVLRTVGGAAVAGGAAGCGTGTGGVAARPTEAATSSLDPYFPGHGAGGFLVNRYTLDLAYSQSIGRVAGTATIRVLPYTALSGLSLDLAAGMNVVSVRANGVTARFSRLGDKLRVQPARPLPSGQMATLDIAYAGAPGPVAVTGVGQVGWQPIGSGVGVLSLPTGAPTWFPCADAPSLKAAYSISVTVPTGLSVLANGRLMSKTPQDFGTRWTYQHNGPMAPYLATVQIGDFTVRETTGPSGVQIRNAYPAALAGSANIDLGRQSQMLTTFASLFGPYPFDVYGTAVVDAALPDGLYGTQTLGLLSASMIDGKRTHEALVARGLALQWFGGSVSVDTWRDIWLSSGFALYAQWVWSEKSGGALADVSARAAMKQLAGLGQALILADPGADRILDPRVALRGACFLHALRLSMGDQTFFQLLRVWCNRNQSGAAQTGDFVGLVPQVYTGQDLTQFMVSWLDKAPLPQLPPRIG